MRDKSGDIIYVGKAKRLKHRVLGYFSALDKHTPKVLSMVERVADFDVIVTTDEFEALVLECSLIKLHAPKYNILLKDDKGYSYLRVDVEEAYPRITEVKQKASDNALYIGPYISAWVVRQTADEANKMFGLPSCRRVFPRDLKKGRPCLNFHIGQCMGVCRGNVSAGEYRQSLQLAVDFIKGGALETKRILTRQMEDAAESLNFEAAAKCRDRIRALEGFSERQRLVYSGVTDQDVLAFVQAGNDTALSLLRFRSEKLVDKLDFMFENALDRDEVRREFLLRFYSDVQHDLPPLITVDDDVADAAVLEEFLSRRAKRRVRIVSPSRGDKARLVDLARKNAAQNLSQRESRRSMREVASLDELARLLGLTAPPPRIEAYDISNIGSDVFVGAMAVFVEGKYSKKESRRFSIRGFFAPDDYACMQQMISRRLQRARDEDAAFMPLPDLILVDGGTGHAQAAAKVLEEFNLEIPVFGMVKDDRHRTRAVTAKGGEITISSVRSVFTLISNIQDTVHRSAVEYARASHKKTAFEMSLTAVPGIGPKRAKALFLYFKTKKAILKADEDALCQVPGMNRAAAKALRAAVQCGGIG